MDTGKGQQIVQWYPQTWTKTPSLVLRANYGRTQRFLEPFPCSYRCWPGSWKDRSVLICFIGFAFVESKFESSSFNIFNLFSEGRFLGTSTGTSRYSELNPVGFWVGVGSSGSDLWRRCWCAGFVHGPLDKGSFSTIFLWTIVLYPMTPSEAPDICNSRSPSDDILEFLLDVDTWDISDLQDDSESVLFRGRFGWFSMDTSLSLRFSFSFALKIFMLKIQINH